MKQRESDKSTISTRENNDHLEREQMEREKEQKVAVENEDEAMNESEEEYEATSGRD